MEGICVQPSDDWTLSSNDGQQPLNAFRASEVLAVYGGLHRVVSLCTACPANATAVSQPNALAGCYGWFTRSDLCLNSDEGIEDAASRLGMLQTIQREFRRTRPMWYGLWMDSPLANGRVRALERLITQMLLERSTSSESLGRFLSALSLSDRANLPIHVMLNPCGQANATSWTLPAHCPACKATWIEESFHCAICGRTGRPNPARKRNVLGRRPYMPLERFLNRESAAAFRARYMRYREAKQVASVSNST